MSKVIIDSNTAQHISCRIYILNCSYQNVIWQDDPQQLMILIRDKCDRLLNFTYKTIKVINVKKALGNELEVHIGDVTYKSTDRLSATDIDFLRQDLQTSLSLIPNFLFERIDVILDIFLHSPSLGYIFDSMSLVL